MKKSIHYIILFSLFAFFTFIIVKFRKEETLELGIKLRQGESATTSEWLNSKNAIESLIETLRRNPANAGAKIKLAFAYIQESRASGNHAYYDSKAAELFDIVLKEDTANYEALIGKATVLLSQHHFAEAIPVALAAQKVNPYSAAVYGILTDAFVEDGNYENAITMADKMAELRPDIRSYSRISYLREIYGDYPGAIEAMKLAVSAGYPGMEQTEWSRIQLGHLYEQTGDLTTAKNLYDDAIYFRPAFANAYAGLARIDKANKNYAGAISNLNKALSISEDFSFQQELTEVYRISNQPKKASESAHRTIALLSGTKEDATSSQHGHYADKELAFAYLEVYDYTNALKHALIEYNRRPDNIDVEQTIAWVYYKLGQYNKANDFISQAIRTNSQNPVLLFQAGLIKKKVGDRSGGSVLIKRALETNPFISPLLQWEVEPVFAYNR
ncbi:MAG: tetratricopeptide repeat protein [Bacteroidetes bacterium]|nr:tetratricopeptide repeat protein [Bacteroidota bacterium]